MCVVMCGFVKAVLGRELANILLISYSEPLVHPDEVPDGALAEGAAQPRRPLQTSLLNAVMDGEPRYLIPRLRTVSAANISPI